VSPVPALKHGGASGGNGSLSAGTGDRLAAEGSTRLQRDRYSVKARGEARGHRRTDTRYNALGLRVFRAGE
jgi:hypothetical protein